MNKLLVSSRFLIFTLILVLFAALMPAAVTPVTAANPWQAVLYSSDTGTLIRINSSGSVLNTYTLPTLSGDILPWQVAVSPSGGRVAYVMQNTASSERRFEVYDLNTSTLMMSYVITAGPMDWVYDNLEIYANSLIFDPTSNSVVFGYVINDVWEMVVLNLTGGGTIAGYLSATDPAASGVEGTTWVPIIRYYDGADVHFMMIPPATEGMPTYPAYRWNVSSNTVVEDSRLNAIGDFNADTGEAVMALPDNRFPDRADELLGPGWHANTLHVYTPPSIGSFPFYADGDYSLGGPHFIQGGERVLVSAWGILSETQQWRVLERSGVLVGLIPTDGYLSDVHSLSDGFVYLGDSSWMAAYFPGLAGLPNTTIVAAVQTTSGILTPGTVVWTGIPNQYWRLVWLREEGTGAGPVGGWAELASPSAGGSSPTPSSGVCEPLPPSVPRLLTIPGNAIVTPEGRSLNVRREPGTGARIVTIIYTGTVVEVLDGPCTIDGYIWWRVNTVDGRGWVAQGDGTTLWIQPHWGDSGGPAPTLPPAVPTSPPAAGLSAPIQMSPADGSLLTVFPRMTTLQWQPVSGAVVYRVQIQWCEGPAFAACNDYPLVETSMTSHTFNFIGDQPGRWRVWAVGSGSVEGPQSPWWSFTYNTLPPAPVVISPADGAVFDIFPRTTTLQWQPVPGATSYKVEIQWCQAGFVSCSDYPLVTTGNTSHTFDFIGAQPGRWRVWAVVGGIDGQKSAWYTFRHSR